SGVLEPSSHSSPLSSPEPIGISVRHPSDECCAPVPPRCGRGVTEETTTMFNCIVSGRAFGRSLALGGMMAGATLARGAGSPPRGSPPRKAQTHGRAAGAPSGKSAHDTVLAAIDLEKEPANIRERQLRFRKLTIGPGGIVPWHSHADRPAIIYIAEGEIIEYASNCADPIVHKAGDIRPETSGTAHWWQNPSSKTVVLFVGDVLHDKSDHNM